jgi:hypothetical protein
MPITYQMDVANGLIRTHCFGDVTLAEVIDHFRELEADPRCPCHVDVLLDVTEEVTIPTSDELRNVALAIAGVRRRVTFGFCAIAASATALFGMMRMFEVFTEKYFLETRACRTVEEAEAWLASKRPASSSDALRAT